MNPSSSNSNKVLIDNPNELGFAKISIRDGEQYREGIVDARRNEVIHPQSNLLVNEITGNMALVQVDRKFLFVPLDQGSVSADDLASVDGFQYAEPYRCGLALVVVDDRWFYIDLQGNRAFEMNFDFAESFHQNRALVKQVEQHRILDTHGNVVKELNYDQINPQSPWCWQVTKIENETYTHGFVDLDGNAITELIYDEVGYYDPDVKRIRVGRNGLYGFLDEHAKVAIPIQYEYAEIFNHGKAKVMLDGRSFFINSDGVEVTE